MDDQTNFQHSENKSENSLNSNLSSSVSIEAPPFSNEHQIVIDRSLLFTKDFYSLNSKKSKEIESPECNFKEKSKFSRLTEKIKSTILPKRNTKSHSKPFSTLSFLSTIFPIVGWLSSYNVRENLQGDLIAGATIFAMHIPNGLACGPLAGVDPMIGIYVSLFPVVIYSIFGGSRHISIGTFAVIAIACRDVIEQVNGGDIVDALNEVIDDGEPPVEILTSLCLLVGLIQLVVGVLRLGVLATLLSDPIISAFAVGAAVHVFTSQIFAIFDISSAAGTAEENIPFELVRSYYRFFSRLPNANVATTIISAVLVCILIGVKNYLEPFLIRRFKLKMLIIPIDIITIVVITFISHLIDFNGRYGVHLIPKINGGFDPMPVMPRFDLWPKIITPAILIAFICYTSTYSLEKLYAHKHHYDVQPNQELLAMGLANVGSSFFLSFPAAASLSRTALQDKVGGKTQVVGLFSSVMIVIFILFFSQFLESLPMCTLSCIINVALISTLAKCMEISHYWKISKFDGIVWIVTLLLVCFVGVDFGLLYSIGVGLAMLVLRLALPSFNLKQNLTDSECYLEEKIVKNCQTPTPGIVIFEFHSPLLFINIDRFLNGVQDEVLAQVQEQATISSSGKQSLIHTVIFDMSHVSYLDGKAVECLLELEPKLKNISDSNKKPVRLLLACPSKTVLKTLDLCKFFNKFDYQHCFITTHDAVVYARKN